MAFVEYDKFIFFGDSITQLAFSQEHGFGFAAAVSSLYNRAVDVVIRGFAGATSKDAVTLFPQCVPAGNAKSSVKLLTIFFGANDSVLPGTIQHVPLAEYKSNITKLVTHNLLRTHPDLCLVLVTPPPCDVKILKDIEEKVTLNLKQEYESSRQGSAHGSFKPPVFPQRSEAATHAYAEAIKEIGRDHDIPVLDLWSVFNNRVRSIPSKNNLNGGLEASMNGEPLLDFSKYLWDGLHLSGEGYRVMFEEFINLIESCYPQLSPAKIPLVFVDEGYQGPFVLNKT